MSRTAKTFFALSVLVATASIGGVHLLQQQERDTMYAGVIKDEARMAAKRQQKLRELEFEDQARKRAYLESLQGVSNPTGPAPPVKGDVPTSSEGMDFGCKTGMCERP
ncbi:hypothetical protein T439DRAFT_328340 [Meredithblackwellia eburnea MCA 4105]